MGLDNGLTPSRWQAIIWTNKSLVYIRLYAALDLDALRSITVKNSWPPYRLVPWVKVCAAGLHYDDVMMGSMASQITSPTIGYLSVYSGADQRKHKRSASLAFVRGIHRWPVSSPHKGPVTWKMFPFNGPQWNLLREFQMRVRCKQIVIRPFHIFTHCVLYVHFTYLHTVDIGAQENTLQSHCCLVGSFATLQTFLC